MMAMRQTLGASDCFLPHDARMADLSASLSATSRGSPLNRVPILFVTYAQPTLAAGSAKPSAPPAPGDPNELALPKGNAGVDFMKPRENWMPWPFIHSSYGQKVG